MESFHIPSLAIPPVFQTPVQCQINPLLIRIARASFCCLQPKDSELLPNPQVYSPPGTVRPSGLFLHFCSLISCFNFLHLCKPASSSASSYMAGQKMIPAITSDQETGLHGWVGCFQNPKSMLQSKNPNGPHGSIVHPSWSVDGQNPLSRCTIMPAKGPGLGVSEKNHFQTVGQTCAPSQAGKHCQRNPFIQDAVVTFVMISCSPKCNPR